MLPRCHNCGVEDLVRTNRQYNSSPHASEAVLNSAAIHCSKIPLFKVQDIPSWRHDASRTRGPQRGKRERVTEADPFTFRCFTHVIVRNTKLCFYGALSRTCMTPLVFASCTKAHPCGRRNSALSTDDRVRKTYVLKYA